MIGPFTCLTQQTIDNMKQFIRIAAKDKKEADFFHSTFDFLGDRNFNYGEPNYDGNIKDCFTIDLAGNKSYFVCKGEGCHQKEQIFETWREFVLFYLEDKYIMCPNSEAKKFVGDWFGLSDWGGRRYESCNHIHRYFIFSERKVFYTNDTDNKVFEDKKRTCFHEAKRLLQSITNYETNNKTMITEIPNIELTPEETLFIRCMFGGIPNGIIKEKIRDAQDFKLLRKYIRSEREDQLLIDDLYNKFCAFINQNKQNFIDAAPNNLKFEYTFANGLNAKYDIYLNSVKVGCWEKTIDEWIEYCRALINAGLDNFTIQGNYFTVEEVGDFKDKLSRFKVKLDNLK